LLAGAGRQAGQHPIPLCSASQHGNILSRCLWPQIISNFLANFEDENALKKIISSLLQRAENVVKKENMQFKRKT
jgi:hypothetical protein